MNSNISNDETISRYILTRKHNKPSTGEVKYNAFIPMYNKHEDCLETSVFRIDDLSEEEIWLLGDKEVANNERNIHGRADLKAQQVKNSSDLTVEVAEPPDRHAVIVGWPHQREDQIELARELAKATGEFKKKPE